MVLNRNNILLADCQVEEVVSFAKGLNEHSNDAFAIQSHIANWKRTGKKSELKRYFAYFRIGWKYYRERKKYHVIIGWQQFYVLIISFFYSIFHAKKQNILVALNFTYKEKKGKSRVLYRWFMKKCLTPEYMDYLHVLSFEYADTISREFNFPRERILVTPFGVDDCYEQFRKLQAPRGYAKDSYALAIGRSNRDFDFLIESWSDIDYPLVVIGDTYTGTNRGNSNVMIRRDIAGSESYPWIANCKMMIIPLDDPTVCSGDTVLLNAMACKKNVIITKPSTLAEMYIHHNIDGYAIRKERGELKKAVETVINSDDSIGEAARQNFLNHFSREKFGERIAKNLNHREEN